MSDSDGNDARINAYLLKVASEELDEAVQLGIDPYSKFAYDRLRELYWTSSRALGHLLRLAQKFGKMPEKPRGATLSGVIPAPPQRARLLIDMTAIAKMGGNTGIQRVVREIARNCVETGAGLPVVIDEGQIRSFYRHPALPEQVEPGVGDILLILDAAWNYVDDYPPVMQMIKARGGKSVVCIYDILPLTYPSLFQPRTVQNFQDWHERIVRKSDAAIAISHATAESLLDFTYKGHAAPASPFPVGWWPLGADFAKTAAEGVACKEVAQVAGGEPYFLSVGTLEPRKGYPTALDAFERLWRAGSGARYVIVGRPGWNTRALQKRLRNHPELGRRLFWFSNASDADLQLLYAQARGVMLASVAEGFGLPLVEAALHGVPVIASDIPVFREVGGDGARYFKLLDPASLATAIEETLAQPKAPPAIKTISWAESAKRLVKVVREEAYQLRG